MNIFFVGLYGVPELARACDVRLAFFANMLSESNSVTVLNRYSSKKDYNKGNVELSSLVVKREIIPPKNTGAIMSCIFLILSYLMEPFILWNSNRKHKIDIIHVYSGHYFDFVHFKWISRLIKAKVVYQYVEYKSVIKTNNPYHVINDWLCDYKGPKLWDGVITISDFLKEKALKVNPSIVTTKVTPLCDFSKFQFPKVNFSEEGPYLLYCGSFGYFDVIDFIVKSYNQSIIKKDHKLILVLSGKKKDIDQFQEDHKDIKVLTRLSYDTLIAYYIHATALLIPIRPTTKDIARFPNKICEYLASKGVVISTNYGEIPNYFQDGYNAIIADDYLVESFSRKLDDVCCGMYDLEAIRNNAYQTGISHFDISSYKRSMQIFLNMVLDA